MESSLAQFVFSVASARLQAAFAVHLANATLPEARSPGTAAELTRKKDREQNIQHFLSLLHRGKQNVNEMFHAFPHHTFHLPSFQVAKDFQLHKLDCFFVFSLLASCFGVGTEVEHVGGDEITRGAFLARWEEQRYEDSEDRTPRNGNI